MNRSISQEEIALVNSTQTGNVLKGSTDTPQRCNSMNKRDTEPRGPPQNLFVGGCQDLVVPNISYQDSLVVYHKTVSDVYKWKKYASS